MFYQSDQHSKGAPNVIGLFLSRDMRHRLDFCMTAWWLLEQQGNFGKYGKSIISTHIVAKVAVVIIVWCKIFVESVLAIGGDPPTTKRIPRGGHSDSYQSHRGTTWHLSPPSFHSITSGLDQPPTITLIYPSWQNSCLKSWPGSDFQISWALIGLLAQNLPVFLIRFSDNYPRY